MSKERYLRELLGEAKFNELMEQKEIKELLAQDAMRRIDKNKISNLNPVPDVEIEYNPPKKIRCEYCGKTNKYEHDECWRCGAPLPFIEPPTLIRIGKNDPVVDEFEMMNAMSGISGCYFVNGGIPFNINLSPEFEKEQEEYQKSKSKWSFAEWTE